MCALDEGREALDLLKKRRNLLKIFSRSDFRMLMQGRSRLGEIGTAGFAPATTLYQESR